MRRRLSVREHAKSCNHRLKSDGLFDLCAIFALSTMKSFSDQYSKSTRLVTAGQIKSYRKGLNVRQLLNDPSRHRLLFAPKRNLYQYFVVFSFVFMVIGALFVAVSLSGTESDSRDAIALRSLIGDATVQSLTSSPPSSKWRTVLRQLSKKPFEISSLAHDEINRRVEMKQLERQRLLTEACTADAPTEATNRTLLLYTNTRLRYMYCAIPKVGSRSLRTTLTKLENLPLWSAVKFQSLSATEQDSALDSHYKFMFVRNPIERLVSVHHYLFGPEQINFGKDFAVVEAGIKQFYRTDPIKLGPVSFKEFISYLLEDPDVESPGRDNEHWQLYSDLCDPCHIGYDFIGNYETFDDDVTYLLAKLGVDAARAPPITAANLSPVTPEMVKAALGQLTDDEIVSLKRLFQRDFVMFGYQQTAS